MRAYELTGSSLPLRPTTLAEPTPRRGEALVQMRAASFNFIDVAVAHGRYAGATYPLIPLADGAGEVIEVGADVDGVQAGDRVAIHPKVLWAAGRSTAANAAAMRGVNLPGSLRELACVPAETLVRAPDHLTWPEIASLPIAATTAWNALVSGDIGPGKTVVVLGTGGVSVFALQLAKARGAAVIVTSSSDEKLTRAKQLGADHGINYRQIPAWHEKVSALTDGIGADLILETGGAGTFRQSIAAVRQGGVVFTIGFLTGSQLEVDLMPIIGKAIRVQGNNTGSASDLRDVVAAIWAHRISPVVDTVYDLNSLCKDYTALVQGRGTHLGKLAVDLQWSTGV
jgi:NADPH:quinone reductase-like Zn-dependent oxidoreductase